MTLINSDTIVAVATGRGGAIAVIRASGADAIGIVDRIFVPRSGKPLAQAAGYTVHFGEIRDGNDVVDEVLVTVFRTPHSYTGEDAVEISCHGSRYIENRVMQLLLGAGARSATPGEFTVRAFLAGRLDLAQAEAVADLIASRDRAQHSLAMGQMKGGVSSALAALRRDMLRLSSLLELELDFGEEDVEFADREHLTALARDMANEIERLAGSFSLGNAIRDGVPVAIVGRPNAGKSTLLNALVGDDRAIVSDIAGTTRDRIEEPVNIDGVSYRFIDTAGLRDTDDPLERMGMDRTLDAVAKARIVLLVADGGCAEDVEAQVAELSLDPEQKLCVLLNKSDLCAPHHALSEGPAVLSVLSVSAKTGLGLDGLRAWLTDAVDREALESGSAVVSNARHYEALVRSHEAVQRMVDGIAAGVSPDLLAQDIRQVLHHLGTITGEVTTDEILGTIFSKFCIGK